MNGGVYRAYDLSLVSDVELPFPECAPPTDPDVEVRVVDPGVAGPSRDGTSGPESVRRHFEEMGSMTVTPDRIEVAPTRSLPDATLSAYVMGFGLGTVLTLRGSLVLHGSAVRVDGRAVGFLGASGAGKSTTAAAFARRGSAVLADDVLPVTTGDRPRVIPAPSLLKLDREFARGIGVARHVETPSLEGLGAKDREPRRGFFAFDGVAERPVTLERLYLLAEGDGPALRPVDAKAAAVKLVAYTYSRSTVERLGSHERNLDDCVALAERVPVRRLVRGRDVDELDDVVAQVRADVRSG